MQLTNVFVSFLLAAAVSAKGKNGTTSVKSQCKEYAKLSNQVELATNETKLADKFDNNQTAIDAFKAKAADKQTQLDTLSSNSTLMSDCAVIQAHAEAVDSCDQIQSWEKDIATAANDTKLAAKFDNNATKIDAFKAKASAKATKLADMTSNTTLTDFCSVQATVDDCKTMSKLQKEIATVSNTTALQAKFDGNQTKIDKFTAAAAKAQTKLDALMANSTLMSTCSSLTQASTDGKTTTGNAASSTTTAASFAGRIEAAGGMISAAVLAMTAALFML
ncbi:hypothetical protein BKA67DRAFT_665368 [Truncatella angustata]|uniref:Uncharacterized protein n=1 Tax=Truncatella angustata TaxID=152316 RepID=A0A9P8RES2_9PEZI|nr:uncharacterized protein BKA67DRAFT_665368 [Truncatella angustata]KAH6639987.1 hypothetical protein BKA67DRAFT_665368 [Truncatella angustata]KAH8200664.1 hypothetical protein TruAng_005201 [Truncatella angustata]